MIFGCPSTSSGQASKITPKRSTYFIITISWSGFAILTFKNAGSKIRLDKLIIYYLALLFFVLGFET